MATLFHSYKVGGRMVLGSLVGRTLTKVEVFDPWRQVGGPAAVLPLFGALALHFGDMALFCKSPLRYCRDACGTIILGDDDECVHLGYRIDLCEPDQLEAQQNLVASEQFNPIPRCWQRIPPPPRTGGLLHTFPDIERAIGHRLAYVRLTTSCHAALELASDAGGGVLRLTYREDLDGAIQLARPGWHHSISKIILTRPDHPFGWLLDTAPYTICVDGRQWNSVEQFATSFDAERLARAIAGTDSVSTAERLSAARTAVGSQLRARGRQIKFQQHPQLALRLRAISYPVVGIDSLFFGLPTTSEN
jgi:hypothetical protein